MGIVIKIPVYSPTGRVAYYRLPKYEEVVIPPFTFYDFSVECKSTLSVRKGFGYFYDKDGKRIAIQDPVRDSPYDGANAVPLLYLAAHVDYRIQSGVEMKVAIMEEYNN